ncbi:unnamed protein product, partial [Pylaiella littoralis]
WLGGLDWRWRRVCSTSSTAWGTKLQAEVGRAVVAPSSVSRDDVLFLVVIKPRNKLWRLSSTAAAARTAPPEGFADTTQLKGPCTAVQQFIAQESCCSLGLLPFGLPRTF